ncbi:MAG: aminotransferase class V-fold PLP-dependent enzyme [Phycisphaerales bacterium]|nr:aminotransferase class V-fold PLP-dependent enzyme [Phycisphaerales bacterium]
MRRIYLDNAATSFPKPPSVHEAMLRYATKVGASPGRGHYAESREGARLIRQCRERIRTLINGESSDHVVFALNTTDALNLAIKGIVRRRRLDAPGTPIHIVTTAMDHNSVLRPLAALAEEGVQVTYVPADPITGVVDPAATASAIRRETVLVAVVGVSNVSGTIQPIGAIGRLCRTMSVPYLVDAAQALGHIPVDVQEMQIDLLAFPGHKGLLGPQGTGGLYVRPAIEHRIATTREGGTGSWSEHDHQPESFPERLEAGSHNTAGIVGLSEGVRWILDKGIDALRAHEHELITLMLEQLRSDGCRMGAAGTAEVTEGPLHAMRLLGPVLPQDRVGVFGLVHDTIEPAELASMLESQFGILARSGLTCAPRAHAVLGSAIPGQPAGSLRLSFGPFTTAEDVLHACEALRRIGAGVHSATTADRTSR